MNPKQWFSESSDLKSWKGLSEEPKGYLDKEVANIAVAELTPKDLGGDAEGGAGSPP